MYSSNLYFVDNYLSFLYLNLGVSSSFILMQSPS